MRRTATCYVTALVFLGAGCAGSGDIAALTGLAPGAGSEGEVPAALRQALEIGTANAVAKTSAHNGYLDDPRIRIRLPDSLDTMAKALRAVGMRADLDELDVAMNRAAEAAAGEAKAVFWQGIRQMTFADAHAILRSGDSAATRYFERTTRPTLRARYEPIVGRTMSQVGLVRLYDELVARYAALPFASPPGFDLRGYVTDKALDGLFTVLAEEERRIRTDPAARTTELLREVFGPSR